MISPIGKRYMIISVSSVNNLPAYLTLEEDRAKQKFEINKEPGRPVENNLDMHTNIIHIYLFYILNFLKDFLAKRSY